MDIDLDLNIDMRYGYKYISQPVPTLRGSAYWCIYFNLKRLDNHKYQLPQRDHQTLNTKSLNNEVGKYDGQACPAIAFSHLIFRPTVPDLFTYIT